jgi:hypothetical protein
MDATTLASSSRKLKFGNTGSAAMPVTSGMAFPVADLIQTFKPEIEEWAHSQEKKYKEIIRYTGAGDMGLGVLCFHTTDHFNGPSDNVQCKRYACELQPNQVYVELGKIIYYSCIGEYARWSCHLMMEPMVGAVRNSGGVPPFNAELKAINCDPNFAAANHISE